MKSKAHPNPTPNSAPFKVTSLILCHRVLMCCAAREGDAEEAARQKDKAMEFASATRLPIFRLLVLDKWRECVCILERESDDAAAYSSARDLARVSSERENEENEEGGGGGGGGAGVWGGGGGGLVANKRVSVQAMAAVEEEICAVCQDAGQPRGSFAKLGF